MPIFRERLGVETNDTEKTKEIRQPNKLNTGTLANSIETNNGDNIARILFDVRNIESREVDKDDTLKDVINTHTQRENDTLSLRLMNIIGRYIIDTRVPIELSKHVIFKNLIVPVIELLRERNFTKREILAIVGSGIRVGQIKESDVEAIFNEILQSDSLLN
jgi:hypothetical protein